MAGRRLASRSMRISGLGALRALARASELEAQGKDIIHLEIGEPDFDTPTHVVEAGIAAIRAGRTRYGATAGTVDLRQAVADYVSFTRGASVGPDHVIITPGVKAALFYTIMSLIEAGDEVIIPDPGFPAYPAVVRFAGGLPVSLPLRIDNGFQPDLDELRSLISPRTTAIILNSPANPTGAVWSPEALAAIAEIAMERDLWLLSDEIYAQLYFNDEAPASVFSLPGAAERTILVDGFSKSYAMTGWRLGFGVFPRPLVEPMLSMMVNNHSCVPLFVQDAGLSALLGPQEQLASIRTMLRLRRDELVSTLNRILQVHCPLPQGAFYAMMDVSGLRPRTAEEIVEGLLDAGVSLLPGGLFGRHGAEYVRLSYTVPTERLKVALERIYRALNEQGKVV